MSVSLVHPWMLLRVWARVWIVLGLLFVVLGQPAATAAEVPTVDVRANAPGWITVSYYHSGTGGVLRYNVEREGTGAVYAMYSPNGQFTDTHLTPDTEYTYRVCAVYEDEDAPACSEWQSARTLPPPQQPYDSNPPIIMDAQLSPDSIRVTWGPTGSYTKILARIDDDRGNHTQVDLPNTPNGSHTFGGLRAGALYRVILKGCTISLNSPCGPWSPDAFFTTPLWPHDMPPLTPVRPDKPSLTLTDSSASSVTLAFFVTVNRVGPESLFIVRRDGTEVARVTPRGVVGGLEGSYTDTIATRAAYRVCYVYAPDAEVCSDQVLRPRDVGELQVGEVQLPCVVGLPGCDDEGTVDYGTCPGCEGVHPDTCVSGFVWREAFPGDTVCVTPGTRSQAAADNAAADQRREPGSPYCVTGYVWREARPDDLVCVTPETRDLTAADNARANERRVHPR